MAIAFNAFASGQASSVTSLTYALTTSGTNRALVVVVVGDSTDKITGVTYGGVAMSLVDKFASDGLWTYAFYLNAPIAGANNVVVSAGSSSAFILSCAASYTGVKQSGQPEASSKSSVASGALSLTETVTTLTDNAWTVLCAKAQSGVPTAGTGSTKRGDDNFGGVGVSALFDSNAAISPAASHSMAFSQANASNPIAGIIVALAPSVALSAGTGSLSSATAANIVVAWTAASGGAPSYTYDIYRSATANFTPGGGNLLASGVSSPYTDSTGAASTPYYYIVRVTDSASATADSNQVGGILKAATVIVYCLGDSITKGTAGPNPAADTPPQLLAIELAKLYAQRAVTATNGGVDGKSAQDYAADTGGILTSALSAATSAGATHILIMLGANDAAAHRTATQFKTDLQTIGDACVADGFTVLINYPTYIPSGANSGATDAAATECTRTYLAKIDELVNGTTYLQGDRVAYAWFLDHLSEVQTDQTHLLESGVQSLAVLWSRAFDRAVLQVASASGGNSGGIFGG